MVSYCRWMLLFFLLAVLSTGTYAMPPRRQRRSLKQKLCRRIAVPMCSDGKVRYDLTTWDTPNEYIARLYWPMINLGCSEHIRLFLCSVAYPSCLPQDGTTLPPCRSLCVQVMQKCMPLMAREYTMSWPNDLQCWQFPNDECMSATGPVLSPIPSSCSHVIDIESRHGARFNNRFKSSRVDLVLPAVNSVVENSSPPWPNFHIDFKTSSSRAQTIFVTSQYQASRGRSYDNALVASLDPKGYLRCEVQCGIVHTIVMDNVRIPLNDGRWHSIHLDSNSGRLIVDGNLPSVTCFGGASECRDFGEVTVGGWMRGLDPSRVKMSDQLAEANFEGCMRNLLVKQGENVLQMVTRYNKISNCC